MRKDYTFIIYQKYTDILINSTIKKEQNICSFFIHFSHILRLIHNDKTSTYDKTIIGRAIRCRIIIRPTGI